MLCFVLEDAVVQSITLILVRNQNSTWWMEASVLLSYSRFLMLQDLFFLPRGLCLHLDLHHLEYHCCIPVILWPWCVMTWAVIDQAITKDSRHLSRVHEELA